MNNIIKRMWKRLLTIIPSKKQQENTNVITTIQQCEKNLSTHDTHDVLVKSILENELNRQTTSLNLITSENLVSKAVFKINSNIFINKCTVGYPGGRYYGGCEFVDELEKEAINRAKCLFKCKYANVQPHSGSQMNQAVMLALLSSGDTIMGMDQKYGGRFTHGSVVHISGMWLKYISYGIDLKTGLIDMNEVLNVAVKYRPRFIIAGSSSYPRTIDWKAFKQVADESDSFLFADISHIAGLIVTGLHPSPIEYCDVVTTTTHRSLRGPHGGLILSNNQELFDRISCSLFPEIQSGPMISVIAAKAMAFFEAQQDDYKTLTKSVIENAKTMVERLKIKGINVISNGTDNHLVIIDLKALGIVDEQVASWFNRCRIIVNKNTTSKDKSLTNSSANIISVLRLSTCACTSRGLKKEDFEKIADMIADGLLEIKDKGKLSPLLETTIKTQVLNITNKYPIDYNV
ncbi:Serine hydroxymethyltransferase [Candidatus Hodgkinia cicadicola]|uniref:Serine hydroxymethyltransferase n=2 Tax=Candidatus Hodgkinia cicadicola TaxID=573658 RepID=A0ABX4MHW2_9HYPH|nr:Serine hydroxymethyltransferase [Candidatus Hodgkinia cicadicola]